MHSDDQARKAMDRSCAVAKRRGACANRSAGAPTVRRRLEASEAHLRQADGGDVCMIEGERARTNGTLGLGLWPPTYHVVVGDHSTLLPVEINSTHAKLASAGINNYLDFFFLGTFLELPTLTEPVTSNLN